jgi:hypothetical protein
VARRWAFELYGFAGWLFFFLIAGLIALPVVLLLLRLNDAIAHWQVSALVSVPLRSLCYLLMVAAGMAAILVALFLLLQRRAGDESRRSSSSAPPATPPS